MDQATMQFLLDAARQEAEQSWQEGGIPIGAVLAQEDSTIATLTLPDVRWHRRAAGLSPRGDR